MNKSEYDRTVSAMTASAEIWISKALVELTGQADGEQLTHHVLRFLDELPDAVVGDEFVEFLVHYVRRMEALATADAMREAINRIRTDDGA